MIYDIAIIGAGASGLMTASMLPKDLNIAIIDSNAQIGAKIKISGGSKCNITNTTIDSSHYLGDEEFVDSILKSLSVNELLEFLNTNGVKPHINEKIVKGTYFCHSSQDVIEMFKKLTYHCHFYMEHTVSNVSYEQHYTIDTNQKTIVAKKLIVASGGLSYPSLGASGIGFDIAKQFGHKVNATNPALVGFTVQKDQFWFKQLSGLSLEAQITVQGKKLYGSMLFTHKGCSGPVILNSSLYWKKGIISIDFLPTKNSYLPKRFMKFFKEQYGNSFDKNLLHDYTMAPAGNFGYTKAEVTKGGIDVNEIDSKSMQSKLQKDLYFIGEVLDVTGELGGYNFHWAFACAKTLKEQLCA